MTESSEAGAVWTSFASLRTEVASWDVQQVDESNVVVEGQLVHQRRISRKCSFYDLAESSAVVTADAAPTTEASAHEPVQQHQQRLEVILKIIDDELSIDQVDAIRHGINVGDIVRIHGFIERSSTNGSSILLHARNITPVTAWKELHPGVPFMPVPTIRKEDSTQPSKAPSQPPVSQASTPIDQAADASTSIDDDVPSDTTSSTSNKAVVVHCKFWINSRTCQYGDKCELFHVSDANLKAERAKWLQERLHLKRMRAKHDDDPLDAHGKNGKQQRAQVFVEWLVAEFGITFLSQGSGVVDVAGGRGNVSFELWNKRQIPCTLIDPRSMKLSKTQFKYMKKLNKDKSEIQAKLVPQKLDLFNTTTFLENPENEALVKGASLLVGMHPDEATDAIIDVAVKFDKPFVLVPCCVFGHKFPHRVLPNDGGKVVSYEDLVVYLQAKHPEVEKAFLPFDGKNLVLFRRPASMAASLNSVRECDRNHFGLLLGQTRARAASAADHRGVHGERVTTAATTEAAGGRVPFADQAFATEERDLAVQSQTDPRERAAFAVVAILTVTGGVANVENFDDWERHLMDGNTNNQLALPPMLKDGTNSYNSISKSHLCPELHYEPETWLSRRRDPIHFAAHKSIKTPHG